MAESDLSTSPIPQAGETFTRSKQEHPHIRLWTNRPGFTEVLLLQHRALGQTGLVSFNPWFPVLGLFSPVVSKRTDNSYFEAFLLHVCTPLVCPICKCMPVNVCTCMCVCSAALPTALVILVPVLRGSLLVGQLRSRSPLPWCDRRAVTSTRRPLAESAGSSSRARAWVSSQLRVHTIWYAHTNELTAQCICAGAHTYIHTHWGLHPGVDWQ